jgi:hypothetical protein
MTEAQGVELLAALDAVEFCLAVIAKGVGMGLGYFLFREFHRCVVSDSRWF